MLYRFILVTGAGFIKIMFSGADSMRSGEVDRNRESFLGHVWTPDGFGTSDCVRFEICLCSIDLCGFRELIL